MADKPHFTAEQMIAALSNARGMVTLAADQLGCDYRTVENYVKRYPTVAAELKRQRERTTDIAELKLFQAINNGESWAINFYLKTQGRQRGYVEKLDVSILVQQATERIAKEFNMTPHDLLDEAQRFMLEERNAS